MGLDSYCFLFGLTIIPFLFLFFPNLFFNQKFLLPFYIGALTLAILGLTIQNETNSANANFYLFLFCPIFSLTILRIELYIFNSTLKRNPKYPPRISFDDGYFWDRFFYLSFMMVSIVLPILIVYFYS